MQLVNCSGRQIDKWQNCHVEEHWHREMEVGDQMKLFKEHKLHSRNNKSTYMMIPEKNLQYEVMFLAGLLVGTVENVWYTEVKWARLLIRIWLFCFGCKYINILGCTLSYKEFREIQFYWVLISKPSSKWLDTL